MHILVAVDSSRESQNALENAIDIVSTFDGNVTAAHVRDPASDTSSDGDLLDGMSTRGEGRDVPVDTEILSGDPVSELVTYAERNGIDAIYVGHRGLTSEGSELHGERRGPLGSVAKGLVERTQIPVTVFDRGL